MWAKDTCFKAKLFICVSLKKMTVFKQLSQRQPWFAIGEQTDSLAQTHTIGWASVAMLGWHKIEKEWNIKITYFK